MGRKKNTPTDCQFMMAEVIKTERISPNFVRLTLAGLDGLKAWGSDQWCRLFFTRQGQDVLALPTRTTEIGWYLQYLATPKARRPWVRAYTVRETRPDVGEVDIDFVIHENQDSMGPAAKFALEAQPGDQLGFLDQGSAFTPDHPHDWTLLVGDETALPAIAGICRSLPETAEGIAIIEIPIAADRQEIVAPTGMDIRWIARDESSQVYEKPGEIALKALMDATLPKGEVHAHVIGESALATGARRHLIQDRGISKRHVDFVGYWRHGRAQTS
ncbi:siderophore-interacting protein [Corynebacterium glutamicum]|uniref:siderophore-interacting protein n=1 Tax=Corynebacterium glutamicum TaxID=1718 RepID=UPI0014661EDF|nr:siderophore-interacting protein [Corynebacterium glutamicum]GFK18435.1 siderophore-interacting protein [Corynebacterium glutamicum]